MALYPSDTLYPSDLLYPSFDNTDKIILANTKAQGNLLRGISRSLTSSLAARGIVIRGSGRNLRSDFTIRGEMLKFTGKRLTASLSVVGKVNKGADKSLKANLTAKATGQRFPYSENMRTTINGVDEAILFGSFGISDVINARSTFSFGTDTLNQLTVGQEVLVTVGKNRIFGGTIDSFSRQYIYGTKQRFAVTCVDFNQILDRRIIGETYENITLKDILIDILANFLDGEGITLGSITSGTAILYPSDTLYPLDTLYPDGVDIVPITQAVFNYCNVADAFKFLKEVTGLSYNIDYNKVLTFFHSGANPGMAITDECCMNIEIEETRQEYRNTQYVRAGDGTTTIQTNEIPTPKPDGVSKTFNLRFPIATKPTIFIGAVQVDPMQIGINGLDENKQWYWQKNSSQITQDNASGVLTDVQIISVTYKGLRPIIIKVDNPTGKLARQGIEGGSGIYESIISQPNLDNKQAGIEYAQGLLKKYGEVTNQITVYTREKREAGQMVLVDSKKLGIVDYYLITNVSVSIDGDGFVYTMKGTSGEDLGDWVEFFRKLAPLPTEKKENETIIKIKVLAEPTTQTGSYKITKLIGVMPITEVIKYD